jgi:hypothetical protein
MICLCERTITHDVTIYYSVLYSIKNITKGDEIRIMYGYKRGHHDEDDFKCDCGKSVNDRQKLWSILDKISLSKN